MTKEEALRILDTIPTKGDEVDALEMAIEALEREVDVSTDTISRQAAIDAIHKAVLEMFDFCDDIVEEPLTYTEEKMLEINKLITSKIRGLPSAQPEIIRCKECNTGLI